MCKTKFFLALFLSVLFTANSVAQISGLRRLTTEEDDLVLLCNSDSLVRDGFPSDSDNWPALDIDNEFVAAFPDTFAQLRNGHAENHMNHTAYATPSEGAPGQAYGPRSVLVSLDSSGLSQGLAEVYLKPTGGPSSVNANSLSETIFYGSFSVLVDPPAKFKKSALTLLTNIDLRFSGSPYGGLHNGAYLYKRVGATFLEATYSSAEDLWVVTGQKVRGDERRRISEIHYGQDLVATINSEEWVDDMDSFVVAEETDFTVSIGANNGTGPSLALMQYPVVNHGTGRLQLRKQGSR